MSKIIKAKVYYKKLEGRTTYSGGYPIGLTDSKTRWLSEGDITEKGEDEKGTYVNKIAIVDDDTLANIAIETGQCYEITEEEADIFGKKFSKTDKEYIDNEKEVIKICAKIIANEELTQQEKNAIDSNSDESGVLKPIAFDITKHIR